MVVSRLSGSVVAAFIKCRVVRYLESLRVASYKVA